jgi:isopenicillin N synthase-like dioxygenase
MEWPDESHVPGFRQAVRNYIRAVHDLADEFKILVAEALDLEPSALLRFFDDRPGDRFKLIRYPPPSSIGPRESDEQHEEAFSGIGPHKDGTFLTFLLQGTPHSGLEIQNKRGEWIPALPIPGTLVVNIGRMFEALTGGICTATTHRVSLREQNFMDDAGTQLGPRYSFPMFLPFRLDLTESEMPLEIPEHIADYVRGEKVKSDARGMSQAVYNVRVGDGVFMGSAIKHPRVAHRWYPEILASSQAASI